MWSPTNFSAATSIRGLTVQIQPVHFPWWPQFDVIWMLYAQCLQTHHDNPWHIHFTCGFPERKNAHWMIPFQVHSIFKIFKDIHPFHFMSLIALSYTRISSSFFCAHFPTIFFSRWSFLISPYFPYVPSVPIISQDFIWFPHHSPIFPCCHWASHFSQVIVSPSISYFPIHSPFRWIGLRENFRRNPSVYLVAHPTNRKWVSPLITGVN